MKKVYILILSCVFAFYAQAQNPNNSHALKGTCLNPDEGTIDFIFDLNQNCPEVDPNNELPGITEMGLHSGVNDWSVIAAWDDPEAITLMNNGGDSFLVTINTVDYWNTAIADIETIRVIPNDGALNPDDPWGDGNSMRDTTDGGGFGGDEPCSDMIIYMDQTPTCADLSQETSLVLFSDAGDSQTCVDAADGLIQIDMDYNLACPEGDSTGVLAGASSLGFHSGANDWAEIVAWDDAGAVQLTNDGADNFSVIIDAAAYYGIPFGDIENIIMIGNNGPNDPDAAWDNVIKDPEDGGAFGNPTPCSDLKLVMAEAPQCDLVLGTENVVVKRSMKVTPNPFRNRTFIEFDNPENQYFDLVVTDMTGRIVRTMNGVSGERIIFERENLPAGIYSATLQDEKGDFATTKLVVK